MFRQETGAEAFRFRPVQLAPAYPHPLLNEASGRQCPSKKSIPEVGRTSPVSAGFDIDFWIKNTYNRRSFRGFRHP
jgi:hypothetical protein